MKQAEVHWRQAALALGLAALLPLLVYAALIMPALAGRQSFQQRLDELQARHGQLARETRQLRQRQEELAALDQGQPDPGSFLEDKPEALAAADLQRQIKGLVEGNQGDLVSTQVAPGDSASLFPEVVLKVHLHADIHALQKILYELASARPALLLDNLLVQKQFTQPAPTQAGVKDLEARFDVIAYIYRNAPP